MSSNSRSLSDFLALNRTRYLDALKEDKGQDWTVVVGNEAGDLDSVASSISYSYLASTLCNRPTIALLQTPRADLPLRAENLYAYEICHILPAQTNLLCIDDIPIESLPLLSTSSFALVDHNRLTSRFSAPPFSTPPTVVAIIDHHEDEGAHEVADPRLITVPVGSCSSLVTQYFAASWRTTEFPPPRELATLLLCAIFMDTNGLKDSGKAVPIDRDAVDFLFPKSTFAPSELTSKSFNDNKDAARVMNTLDERKQSVCHLSTRDLLRRDYKEYSYPCSRGVTTVGLATVPQNPNIWFQKEAFQKNLEDVDAWLKERDLDALGILYTYTSKGKHERQELWVVRSGRSDIKEKLWEGLEASEKLRLERRNVGESSSNRLHEDEGLSEDLITQAGNMVRLWFQGDRKATRKVVAPLVKELLENL